MCLFDWLMYVMTLHPYMLAVIVLGVYAVAQDHSKPWGFLRLTISYSQINLQSVKCECFFYFLYLSYMIANGKLIS